MGIASDGEGRAGDRHQRPTSSDLVPGYVAAAFIYYVGELPIGIDPHGRGQIPGGERRAGDGGQAAV